jgi:outer membrane lipoprotein-sorting protein
LLTRFATSQSFEQISFEARIQLAAPERYRIDYETDRAPKAQTIVCDGARVWTVYADRVAVRAAKPLPDGLSQLTDLSWLLDGLELTSAGAGRSGGRAAILISAVVTGDAKTGHSALSPWPTMANQIDLAIDAELGIVLSQQWKFDDQMLLRTELTNVGTDVAEDEFSYEAAPGIRVLDDPSPLAEAGLSSGKVAWQVAKGTTKLLGDVVKWLGRGGPGGGR